MSKLEQAFTRPSYDVFVAWLLEQLDVETRHKLIAAAEQTLDATASASDATTLEASLESFVVEAAQLPSTRQETPGDARIDDATRELYAAATIALDMLRHPKRLMTDNLDYIMMRLRRLRRALQQYEAQHGPQD